MANRIRVFIVLSFGFVLLGIGTSSFGVVWPSLAEEFGRSTGELGLVTLAYGVGYTASSLVSGRIAARSRFDWVLMWAALTSAVALTVLAASPGWVVFLAAATVLGAAGGQIDSAANAYVALRHGSRAMGLLHGAFGVGMFAGPLLVTGLLYWGLSWRIAFAVLAIGQLVYASGLRSAARRVDRPVGSRPARQTLRGSAVLWWSVGVFFLYAGVASGLGTWTFTFLTQERGLGQTTAGLVVTAYFIGFTASRLLLGVVGDRFAPTRLLRWSAVATVAGVAVFWWSPTIWMSATALVFAGFAHGPVFPLEMLLTAERFGPSHAPAVVGFEIAAANVGFALVPAVIGVLVDFYGLTTVPVALFASSLLVWAAIEKLQASSARDAAIAVD
jgi:fucose permease